MKKLKLEELGRLSIEEFKATEKLQITILLDNVRSLHNVGSAFRTADAFRIERIILSGITGKPPHSEIHKTALGATESVEWKYTAKAEDAVKELKEMGYLIVLIEQTSESTQLHAFNPEAGKKYCLVFGNEVHGISEEVIPYANIALEVPQGGTKHSLNISVCLGIVMWEFYKKLSL